MVIGDRILALRQQAGLTQQELANHAGLSKTHIYQLEKGKRKRLRMETLIRLAAALGVKPDYLDPDVEGAIQISEIPTPEVVLRHRTELSEAGISQVMNYVRALEALEREEH